MKKAKNVKRKIYEVLTRSTIMLLLFFFILGQLALVYTDLPMAELIYLSTMGVSFLVGVYCLLNLIEAVSALLSFWGKQRHACKQRVCSKLKQNELVEVYRTDLNVMEFPRKRYFARLEGKQIHIEFRVNGITYKTLDTDEWEFFESNFDFSKPKK